MLNERIILAKLREGDIKAFEEIFRYYYIPLCWYAAGITGNMESAEEIVEDLFYVLWKNREQLRIFRSVKSYLYRAVRNEAVQYCEHRKVKERYRSAARVDEETDCSPGPHEWMEYKELKELVNQTLDKLPARQRQIFRMHRVEGKKYAEIASTLSLSVKTVEAEMTKVLRALFGLVHKYH